MELGATVCAANAPPACGACPLAEWCAARAGEATGAGAAADLPTRVARAAKREEAVAVAVVRLLPPAGAAGRGGAKYLLVKRPPGGLLAGLWELPLAPVAADAPPAARRAALDALLERLLGARPGAAGGVLQVEERRPLGDAVHVFSHIRMTMRAEALTLRGALPAAAAVEKGETAEGAEGAEDGGAACAELLWLSEAELAARGLSSGVRKVLTMWDKARGEGGKGIAAFFQAAKGKAAGGGG
jgi:A/G-specific adenine glycosylase